MTDLDRPIIDPDRSLGELVTERPGRARVFEAVGLDYCCRGGRSLRAATEAAGLDLDAVITDLIAVVDPVGADIDAMAPDQLADHIESTHHAYLHDELPALVALADKVAGVHGARHPELADVARLMAELRADLEPHLAREEQVLFPVTHRLADGAVDDLPRGAVRTPIAVLMEEHVAAGELLAELRTAAGDYKIPADACASYTSLYQRLDALESDTFRHIHLENNVLFPAVEAMDESR